jgi:hypothetical protein
MVFRTNSVSTPNKNSTQPLQIQKNETFICHKGKLTDITTLTSNNTGNILMYKATMRRVLVTIITM